MFISRRSNKVNKNAVEYNYNSVCEDNVIHCLDCPVGKLIIVPSSQIILKRTVDQEKR